MLQTSGENFQEIEYIS